MNSFSTKEQKPPKLPTSIANWGVQPEDVYHFIHIWPKYSNARLIILRNINGLNL